MIYDIVGNINNAIMNYYTIFFRLPCKFKKVLFTNQIILFNDVTIFNVYNSIRNISKRLLMSYQYDS